MMAGGEKIDMEALVEKMGCSPEKIPYLKDMFG